ncbi:hypothetical protein VTO42DRAFT_7703 [Malbranchea cinnamomea]
MTDSFPSTLTGPTSKERKYDRQLRLWAASGQQELEQSRVLLVNSDGPVDSDNAPVAGVIGVETLKNLVLPGVGGFTIVDPAVVTDTDLGVNFFVSEESLGRSRAQETCKYLQELNPDVKGEFSSQPILELLQNPHFLTQFRLVLVTGPIRECTLRTISQEARRLSIPLIYMHSVGFYAAVSIQMPSVFPIVETHPSPESTQDLRLTNPWPELAATVKKIENLDTLDDHQHGHVPYLLLLLYYLKKWKQTHGGNLPKTYQEKSEFRDLVRSGARTNNPEGGEENFDEAVAAVLKSINPWSLSSGLRDIFNMEQCTNLTPESNNFWIIAFAVKKFYDTHGVLPLPGSLPDMKAQSADYIWLQNIYKSKARVDAAEVEATVRATEAQLNRGTQVPRKEIEVFCKNAAHIKVIKGRDIPFFQGENTDPHVINAVRANLANHPEPLVQIFIALKVLDRLVSEYQNADPKPSSSPLDVPENWTRVLSQIVPDSVLEPEEARERIEAAMAEVRRAGTAELHNISSLAGGVAAQEALKLLTRQYVPLDNTFIFDGVGSKGDMFRL